MQRRMEALPEHTAQATAAIRKALSDQLREIEAITPVLNRPAPLQAPAPEPFRQPQTPSPAQAQFGAAQPIPQFDPRGRQMAQPEGGDIGKVAGGLAQQLAGASHAPRPAGQQGAPWSPGEMAGRSAEGLGARAAPPPQQGGQLRLDEIARAVDYRTATEIWQRFRAGERGVLGRHLYSLDGQATFDEISRRYAARTSSTLPSTVTSPISSACSARPRRDRGGMLQNYLTSGRDAPIPFSRMQADVYARRGA
jgi:hypothetical protein